MIKRNYTVTVGSESETFDRRSQAKLHIQKQQEWERSLSGHCHNYEIQVSLGHDELCSFGRTKTITARTRECRLRTLRLDCAESWTTALPYM